MKTITDITRQKRNKERLNIFIDGEYAFSVAAIAATTLRVDQILQPEEIDKLRASDAVERAKQLSFRFLSYRPRSTSEIRRYLFKKEFDQLVVDQVIERLIELEMLDDRGFARYWVEQRETFRPRGRAMLQQELFLKGISREIADLAIADVNENISAHKAVANKASRWAAMPRAEFLKKVYQFLSRRGFSYGSISEVGQELWMSLSGSDEMK
jgi:regulatory protein